MKEKFKDLLAMAWAYFGALTIGTMYILNDSGNITGNAIGVYNFVNTFFSKIFFVVLICYFAIAIINMRKIIKRKINYGNF